MALVYFDVCSVYVDGNNSAVIVVKSK